MLMQIFGLWITIWTSGSYRLIVRYLACIILLLGGKASGKSMKYYEMRLILMKKLACLLLALIALVTASTSALADTVENLGTVDGPYVSAKNNPSSQGEQDVCSVDITWSEFKFDFYPAEKKWDAENHVWVNDEDHPAQFEAVGSNVITLKNNSSMAVSALFDFRSDYVDVTGVFKQTGDQLPGSQLDMAKPIENEQAFEYTVTFELAGELPETARSDDYYEIGQITIYLMAS